MAFTAESGRNKFWFGTESRLDWFPTPNRGADVSPSGWEAGGSLLNGGGYQLNSFGSHKNYIFEWPESSAREVAQKMKSYADGTYGRGLIYFIDPLTWTTNMLPAQWADPSMGLGYEGTSLVYGVDPVSVPTSGWESNDLPVNSAYYDLAGVAAGWRGKEEAVFIPIPKGYTLSLGSFHSQTGTGRVYYREQATNGALGAITAVTPLANNASQVVNTFISGANLAGVWLYVGKSGSGAGSVTLTAMIGRLIPSVKTQTTMVAQNLFTNPRLVGDGTWAEVARWNTGDPVPVVVQPEDFRVRDLGTGESVMEIERVAGLITQNCIAGVSSRDGKPAVRLIGTGSVSNWARASFPIPTSARLSGVAVGTRHLPTPQSATWKNALRVDSPENSTGADNEAFAELRTPYSGLTSTYTLLLGGGDASQGSGDVWWTDIGLFAGDYDGPAFSGDSGTVVINGRSHRTQWDATPDNSTSSAWTMTPEFDALKEGPWIGGQGHSGCRFIGKPTYVNNTGVDGGQVSFAASFREVGSWVNG